MIHIPPEQIGVPEEVTFTIPIEDGTELVLMVPKSCADPLLAKAAQAHISTAQFLGELLQNGLQDPVTDSFILDQIDSLGPINTHPGSWHFSGSIPIQRPVKKRSK
jgi:hypothetical protein